MHTSYQSIRLLSFAFKALGVIGVPVIVVSVLFAVADIRTTAEASGDIAASSMVTALLPVLASVGLGMFACLVVYAFGAFLELMVDVEAHLYSIDMWFARKDAEASSKKLAQMMGRQPQKSPASQTATSPLPPPTPRRERKYDDPNEAYPTPVPPTPFFVRGEE